MRRHGVGLAAVCLVVVAVLCPTGRLWAGEPEIKVGSYVRARPRTQVTQGNQVLATVESGQALYVYDVQGDSIYVRLKVNGKTIRGRVRRSDVRPELPPRRTADEPEEKPKAGPDPAEADALAKLDRVPVEFLAIYAEALPQLKAKRAEVTFLVPLEGDLPPADLRVGTGEGATRLYRPSRRLSGREFVQIPAPPSRELAAKIRGLLASKRVNPERLAASRRVGFLIGERGDTTEKARLDAARLAEPLWQTAYESVRTAPSRTRSVQ